VSEATPAEKRVHRGARRRERTRDALVAAAWRVMARKGVDATAIAEITEEADVAFGSFYNHFASKEAIVEAVAALAVERHGAALDRLTAAIEDPAEVMAVSVRRTVQMVERDPIWGWFVVRLGLANSTLRAGLGRRAARDLELGIEAGRFAVADVPSALLAFGGAVLAMMQGRLDGLTGDGAAERTAGYVLRMLGVPAAEADAIAQRPLPPTPDLEEETA
jgi:AcrR family transcriptional regulator